VSSLRLAVVLLALAGGLGAVRAEAQAPWLPKLQLDNDAYDFWQGPARRTDEQYTNGVRASLESGSAPWWGRRFASGRAGCADSTAIRVTCLETTISLGQDIYTPNLLRAPYEVPFWRNERPYFGWLYLEGEAQVAGARLLRTTSVSVGVTGAPSLGHTMQSLFHTITRRYTNEAKHWETQIGFEPGVILTQRFDAIALRVGSLENAVLDVLPSAGVSVGNVLTSANAGGILRVGANLSHPWSPAFQRSRPPVELYAIAGGRALYVARDMSLDGTLMHPSRFVTRVPGVREYEFGGGLRIQRLVLEYRAVTRTREYTTGPRHHTYSTMFASIGGGGNARRSPRGAPNTGAAPDR
jgi:lipid A 3-O-deacylase